MNLTQLSDHALDCVFVICKRTIYRWAKKYCDIVPEGKRTLTDKECDTLLHRVKKLQNIVAILKTVNCTVHAPLKEKLYELELLYDYHDVRTLCEALDVSRGTFYNHVLCNKRGNLSKGLHTRYQRRIEPKEPLINAWKKRANIGKRR